MTDQETIDYLQRELTRLAIEGVDREKKLAKLEAEVEHWAQAEQDGRLVVLPLKVGQILYWTEYGEVHEARVLSVHMDECGQYFEDDDGNEFNADEYRDCIGITVFRTREAAETALEAAGKE